MTGKKATPSLPASYFKRHIHPLAGLANDSPRSLNVPEQNDNHPNLNATRNIREFSKIPGFFHTFVNSRNFSVKVNISLAEADGCPHAF